MKPKKFNFNYNVDLKKDNNSNIKKFENYRCHDSKLFSDTKNNKESKYSKNVKEPKYLKNVNDLFYEKDNCKPVKEEKVKPNTKPTNTKTFESITNESYRDRHCNESKPVKFYDNSIRDKYTLDCKNVSAGAHRIEDESFLLLPRVNSKQKTKVELKDKMHPSDYRVNLESDNIRNTKQYISYYGDHYGPGKGFGNTVVSNEIRNGVPTRNENNVFSQRIESEVNDRRDILFKDYQNPNNIILPFPRGGEITRKTVQNNNRELNDNIFSEFKFKY